MAYWIYIAAILAVACVVALFIYKRRTSVDSSEVIAAPIPPTPTIPDNVKEGDKCSFCSGELISNETADKLLLMCNTCNAVHKEWPMIS